MSVKNVSFFGAAALNDPGEAVFSPNRSVKDDFTRHSLNNIYLFLISGGTLSFLCSYKKVIFLLAGHLRLTDLEIFVPIQVLN